MIDEKKLIEELESLPLIHGRYDHENANSDFIIGIEAWHETVLKKINEQPKCFEWIPASEIPEDMKPVLVWFEYFRYGDYNIPYQTYGLSYAYNGEWSGFVNGQSGWKDLKILAWMTLPDPYKAGD